MAVLGLLSTACSGSTSSPTSLPLDPAVADPTTATYTAQMEAICITTAAELDALGQPTDGSAVPEFATNVARIIQSEADAARDLDPPSDRDDDHRAFVANTDAQARGWLELAEIASISPDEIGDQTTQIAQLTLGRDDLATEMQLPECRRDN